MGEEKIDTLMNFTFPVIFHVNEPEIYMKQCINVENAVFHSIHRPILRSRLTTCSTHYTILSSGKIKSGMHMVDQTWNEKNVEF